MCVYSLGFCHNSSLWMIIITLLIDYVICAKYYSSFILTNIFNPHHTLMRQVLQIKLDMCITVGKQITNIARGTISNICNNLYWKRVWK